MKSPTSNWVPGEYSTRSFYFLHSLSVDSPLESAVFHLFHNLSIRHKSLQIFKIHFIYLVHRQIHDNIESTIDLQLQLSNVDHAQCSSDDAPPGLLIVLFTLHAYEPDD